MRYLLLAVLPLLAACASQPIDSAAVCPPVVVYTPAQQAQLADELAKQPADSMIVLTENDYHRERDELRACRATR